MNGTYCELGSIHLLKLKSIKEVTLRMVVRKPNENELETILSLSPQAIFDGTLGEVRPTDEKIERLIKPLLERGSFYLIATEGTDLLGWILLGSNKDQLTDQVNGFIYELFILEEYRGKGFSKKLMHAATTYFKQEGFSEIRLSVKAGNPAEKLYENLGFKTRTIAMGLEL